ncbi:hypothetical protein Slin15195_G048020 [Septoria linicola]|uniref:2EXR domain-containing protein n=1 Tax=Septoria linicola TaxID=215465 RepID=A0A9Q9EJL9_9PEZI|nr:hypothetical protein Slin14017_G051560 [Septoria linicola]USW51483.1 hypothetical protein Slin15195_G048020 [Septoria linicola]
MEISPMSKLSAELRNEIYRLALTTNKQLTICSSKLHDGRQKKPTATQPPLTKVCKQSRRESLQMFYNLNTFIISVSGAPRGSRDLRADFLRQTMEVALWMRCTEQASHQAISMLKLVVYMPWETGRREGDWSSFVRAFDRYGYRMPKLVATVHLKSQLALLELVLSESGFEEFKERQKQKAKDFFSGMGLEVKTTFKFI